MRVETVIKADGKKRYVVVDTKGEIILPVAKFIKYRDNVGAARNTLRAYAYHLKLFFQYLEKYNINYMNINIDGMANFVGWLQMPNASSKVRYITIQKSNRSNRTINSIIDTVLIFYDYLIRHEEYQSSLSDDLRRQMAYSKKGYKDFLYHVNKNKKFMTNIIKLRVEKTRPKILTKEQIQILLDNCTNIRDHFLIRLLWESSIRIGEALSLWIEDFDVGETTIEIKDRGELENFAEIKTVNSPRKIDVTSELMDEFMDYIAEIHTDAVDTNFVFIKLIGVNKYKAMEYQDVVSLFNRLKKKTEMNVHPHMLRHSSLTELRRSGCEGEFLRIRAGHKNIQTTLQMYVHPSDEDIRKEWETVQKNMQLKGKRS